MNRLKRFAPWWLAACAVAIAVLISVPHDSRYDTIWRVAVVIAALTSAFVARRSNHIPLVIAVAVIVAGVRHTVGSTGSSWLSLDDLTWSQTIADTVVGLALIAAVMLALRIRRGQLASREVLDVLTVGTGAGLAAWIALTNPSLIDGADLGLAIMASIYLPVAVIMVVFVIDIWVDGLVGNHAMWLVVGATIANLVGTVVRSLVQTDVLTDGALPVAIGAFTAAFLLLCAALMHRDVRKTLEPLDETKSNPHRETRRIIPIIASLAAPVVLMSTITPTSTNDKIVRFFGAIILIGAVMARLVVALNVGAKAQQTLLRRLRRDDLTDLPNRTRFVEQVTDVLEQTWRSEFRPTVVQLNIDRFKNINDTLGHDNANLVLITIAERLSSAADSFSGVVARSGGDDFMIIDGSTTSTAEAMERVEAVRQALSTPIGVGESSIFVTASIGVAVAPPKRTITAEELIRRADIASHRAKADGRNRVALFDDSMQDHLTHRMDVEHALHGAIGRREMRLYHQPIVDIESGGVSGFEA